MGDPIRLHLVTQIYRPQAEAELHRMLTCIVRNAELSFVWKLTVLAENINVNFRDDKIHVERIKSRATYADLMTLQSPPVLQQSTHFAIVNSDIFLSHDVGRLLERISRPSSVVALSRHEYWGELHPNPMASQDLWVFRSHPFAETLIDCSRLRLGVGGCDHLFAMGLYSYGYNIWNSCLNCEIRHNDPRLKLVYADPYYGTCFYPMPCKIEDIEQTTPSYAIRQVRRPLQ